MEDQLLQEEKSKKKSTIMIPSFQDLSHGRASTSSHSTSRPDTTTTNSSFAQAFSFIKSSEFYTPPPPPPPPPPLPPAEHEHDQRNVAARSDGTGVAASSSSSVSTTGQNRNAILVSHRQKGNPLLKHIRNVKWVFADVVCDYLLGQNSCALYLSLRYHLLHPDYLYFRIRELQKNFKLRVVLCHVDVEDVVKPLLEVTRTALLHDCALLCGWSLEECGRYLETIKVYENKSADNIREQMDNDYLSRLNHALTTVRRVNKTDVLTLGSTFGSLSCIMDASLEELARCPGIGERKVKRLYDTFHEPFRRVSRHPIVLDAPHVDENLDKTCGMEGDVQVQQANIISSKPDSEPTVTVKSALAAAFAKYTNKVNKKDGKEKIKNVSKEDVQERQEGSEGATTDPST